MGTAIDDHNQSNVRPTRLGHKVVPPGALAKPAAAIAPDRLTLTPANRRSWPFTLHRVPGTYDASHETGLVYDVVRIRQDIPGMWQHYGPLFKRVGAEMGVDPLALATYCIFESYNDRKHDYNVHALEVRSGMVAAGIAASQAQFCKGQRIPGLKRNFPKTVKATSALLRANPEVALRVLADRLIQARKSQGNDLALVLPHAAFPAWGDPRISRGAYGTQAQYISRAYVFYHTFQAADQDVSVRG